MYVFENSRLVASYQFLCLSEYLCVFVSCPMPAMGARSTRSNEKTESIEVRWLPIAGCVCHTNTIFRIFLCCMLRYAIQIHLTFLTRDDRHDNEHNEGVDFNSSFFYGILLPFSTRFIRSEAVCNITFDYVKEERR